MDNVSTLRRYGLFDAKVPRYTSYPPANRFQTDVGRRYQRTWLADLSPDKAVSIYVHIPFCRRLCWFCACRTQGTQTLRPVESYVIDLIAEIEATAALAPQSLRMGRLHLGGGTPTLLSGPLMHRLLETLFNCFAKSEDFELSVEIDPTEAAPDVLAVLADWGMRRASIGVQDFHPKVQQVIGREQSFEQTKHVVDQLRAGGVESINADLLYGLPYQTADTLIETLDRVVSLGPDRLALYGYAHVPHVAKRQVMIPSGALPDAETRFRTAQLAQERLIKDGFQPLGIDHFARPDESLAKAAKAGTMRRNFQGYTDDPCETLLGFGVSAISKFKQGYTQNAVSTAAYRECIQSGELAARKGYALTPDDLLIGELIDGIMCNGQLDLAELKERFPRRSEDICNILDDLLGAFPDLLDQSGSTISIHPGLFASARLLATHLDKSFHAKHVHSLAI